MDILVTYDIDTTAPGGVRRLARVGQVCQRYGVRVQYSVFECRLTPVRYQRLIEDLVLEIAPRMDSVHIYRYDRTISDARVTLGRHVSREPGTPWILGAPNRD